MVHRFPELLWQFSSHQLTGLLGQAPVSSGNQQQATSNPNAIPSTWSVRPWACDQQATMFWPHHSPPRFIGGRLAAREGPKQALRARSGPKTGQKSFRKCSTPSRSNTLAIRNHVQRRGLARYCRLRGLSRHRDWPTRTKTARKKIVLWRSWVQFQPPYPVTQFGFGYPREPLTQLRPHRPQLGLIFVHFAGPQWPFSAWARRVAATETGLPAGDGSRPGPDSACRRFQL